MDGAMAHSARSASIGGRAPSLRRAILVTSCSHACVTCITRTPSGAQPGSCRIPGLRRWEWGKPHVAEGDFRPGGAVPLWFIRQGLARADDGGRGEWPGHCPADGAARGRGAVRRTRSTRTGGPRELGPSTRTRPIQRTSPTADRPPPAPGRVRIGPASESFQRAEPLRRR